MRAALVLAAGRAPALAELAIPLPAPGEKLVRVKSVPFATFDQAWPLDDSACRTVLAMNAAGV